MVKKDLFKTVQYFYKKYGMYVNINRAFPGPDGLKPVERRVLYSSYLIAKNKYVKSARIEGDVMGRFHPHGSSYGTIVQLAQQDILEGQGSFGCNTGIEPVEASASRYTECRLPEKTQELAFNLINFVPYFLNPLGQNEPVILPVKYPICLIGKTTSFGIGFGFRTVIPSYEVKDLYKRLLWLLGEKKEKPLILPRMELDILSPPEELEKLLTTGEAKLEVMGKYKENKEAFEIEIYSWPFPKRFEKFLKCLETELKNGDVGFRDDSTTETKIVFSILRQRNKEVTYEKVKQKILRELHGTQNFQITIVNENDEIEVIGVDDYLKRTFSRYENFLKISIEDQIEKLKGSIKEYEILQKIRPYLSQALLKIIKDSDKEIKIISEKSGVSFEEVKEILGKYKLLQILNMDIRTEEMLDLLKFENQKLKEIRKSALEEYQQTTRRW